MDLNKILGYLLLTAGLLLIIFTLYQSYNIFMGNASAPIVFKVQSPLESSKSNMSVNLQDLQKQLNDQIQKQISQIVPTDTVPKILNLLSWSILAGILILGGGQIAGLGIKLIR